MRIFTDDQSQHTAASLLRRTAAIFYDTLLCIALLMVTTGLYMMIYSKIVGAETYASINESGQSINDPLLSSVLFLTLFSFFGYFWTRTGQTLGMQVWHIRIQNSDNTAISWTQALMRFMMAGISVCCLGLGYLWVLFDKRNRSWQCIFSDTQVVRIPKRKS